MVKVTVEEMQQNLLRCLRQVEAGETLVVVRLDEAIAQITPIPPSQQLRPYGLSAGEFVVADDFDSALPEDIINVFEGK